MDTLQLSDSHPYAATFHYLTGKCLIVKQQWKRSERAFYKAIQLANQNRLTKNSNIEAACFNELSFAATTKTDWTKPFSILTADWTPSTKTEIVAMFSMFYIGTRPFTLNDWVDWRKA